MTDREVAERTRALTVLLRDKLGELGFKVAGVYESGNVGGGWTVDAEAQDGFYVNVEVAGGPWEEDGTWTD